MIPRAEAMRHSPTLWGMATAAVGVVGLTVVWNLHAYRHELGTWLRNAARF